MPIRPKNSDLRRREHLDEAEMRRLIKGARKARWGQRDATMILVCWHHGLRAAELCDLRWADVKLKTARMEIRRRKNSESGTHTIERDELRELGILKRAQQEAGIASEFVFVSERGGPFAVSSFNDLVKRAGELAGLSALKPHAHMIRHSTGYALVNDGRHNLRQIQQWMGHKEIANTAKYTALSTTTFKDFWRN